MWGFHPLSKASYMDALSGTGIDGFWKKRYTALPDGETTMSVLEFFTIGKNAGAFLTGSVKGGGWIR